MESGREPFKQLAALILLAAAAAAAVRNDTVILGWLVRGLQILEPFIVGCAIAFVLNLPMSFLEKKAFARWQSRARRPVCLILSLLFVLLLVALVGVMVVPQVVQAMRQLVQQVPVALEAAIRQLNQWSAVYPAVTGQAGFLTEIENSWQTIVQSAGSFLSSGLGGAAVAVADLAGSAVSAVTNLVISLIFSIYILLQKETLARQVCHVIRAYLPPRAARQLLRVCALLNRNFSSFIAGQCVEAVILGTMFAVSMTIFRMPYAAMVGVLIAFTALIPVVGAFIGCVVGAFLILLENPLQALGFIVLFLVLQQIEGNLIYPRVVGSSVGLPPIWVLAAVTIGGSLFGVVGMLVFIPLVSTLYTLLRENVRSRLAAKRADGSLDPDDSCEA